jgi:uncharacterized membrane protein HdeD (DUF308 family)
MTVLGVLAIILGILAMMAPGLTGLSVTVFLGFLVLAGGVVRMIWAFQAGSLVKGILKFILGGLMLACGALLVANPLLASGVVTIWLAVYFIADGFAEIATGFQCRPVRGWGWLEFGGIVSILLGFLIWSQFPLSGTFALGVLLGIKLFFAGLIMVTLGSAMRTLTVEGREGSV